MSFAISRFAAAAVVACTVAGGAGFVGCSSSSDSSSPTSDGGVMLGASNDASSPSIVDGGGATDSSVATTMDATTGGDDDSDGGSGSGDDDDASSDASIVMEDCTADAKHPKTLACTTLYSDFASRTVRSENAAYDPGLHLWSDGADKQRWIYLPPGKQINTDSNSGTGYTGMDEWSFPVGTKIWKEFSFNGKKIETRYMWKNDDMSDPNYGTWLLTTYEWSNDQAQALEQTMGDFVSVTTDAGAQMYEIPATNLCVNCHQGRIDNVLGFEAISLSQPSATGMTMDYLRANNLLTTAPASNFVIPDDGHGSAAALGFLHANCGNACHNHSPSSFAGATNMYLKLRTDPAYLASAQATDTYQSTAGKTSTFQPNDGGTMKRIDPGNHANSVIWYRDGFRDTATVTGVQMPPFDTHVAPATNVAQVAAWIDAL